MTASATQGGHNKWDTAKPHIRFMLL